MPQAMDTDHLNLRRAMARRQTLARAAGFTLVELLVVIAIIALVISILVPTLASARQGARQALNISNQKNLTTATINYGSDFRDKIASFTWKANKIYHLTQGISPNGTFFTTPELETTDLLATTLQALDIIRRRSQPENPQVTTTVNNWIPHPTYSHLVLIDFLAARLPEPMLLNPNDRFRIDLAEGLRSAPNPRSFCEALPASNGGMRSLWPYSSSYQSVPASYIPDRESTDGGFLRQAGDQIYYLYNEGTGPIESRKYALGNRYLHEVLAPAQKVLLMEDVARSQGKSDYPFLHPHAVITLACFDGQVRTLKMIDANSGGYTLPNGQLQRAALNYNAETRWGYPFWPDASLTTDLNGGIRWTYRNLRGYDFGTPEPGSEPF